MLVACGCLCHLNVTSGHATHWEERSPNIRRSGWEMVVIVHGLGLKLLFIDTAVVEVYYSFAREVHGYDSVLGLGWYRGSMSRSAC